MPVIPISILVPTKNEEKNLHRCLDPLAGWADEIVVIDSLSQDHTAEIARSYGATVLDFAYKGGWPKKRQWALDTYAFKNDWILLLDSDEIMLDAVKKEIEQLVANPTHDGYWIPFDVYFLGRLLRYGETRLYKLSLFRKGKGRYEQRIEGNRTDMADMEVHEHVVVTGTTGKLRNPIKHENVNSLSRYIIKHDEYSNWEAQVHSEGAKGELEARFWGTQAERRRWLRKSFMNLPGLPLFVFIYFYIFKLGFLDGKAGLIYNLFRGVQFFHIKAKIYEQQLANSSKTS